MTQQPKPPLVTLHEQARSRQRFGPAILAMVLGLIATLGMWQLARGESAKLQQSKIQARIQELQNAVNVRMAAHEQILRGGVSFINTLGEVSRDQWAAYIADLQVQKNYPGIHGIGYAEYVTPATRDAFVKHMRSQSLPQFDIRPPGLRDGYGPVTFLEPRTERNLRALGFDMLAEPTRLDAMTRARDTGTPAITAPLKLAAEPNTSPALGFLIYLPVYRPHMPLDSEAQRRAALKGFVNSPFRIDDFMQGILGGNTDHVQLRIFDATTPKPSLMYQEPPPASRPAPAMQDQTKQVLHIPMQVHHRTWDLEFETSLAPDPTENRTAVLVLVSGAAISVLLGALTFSLTARVQLMRNSALHYFHLANHDSLTGLPNRAKFQALLADAMQHAQLVPQRFAVLFIDVDNFKEINDSLGHQAGDVFLQQMAVRLQASVRQGDTVARLGGDEFTVILPSLQDDSDAQTIAQNLLNRLSAPIQLPGGALPGGVCAASVSIGISVYPTHASTIEDLLKRADKAMYAAKRNGRNQFQFAPAG